MRVYSEAGHGTIFKLYFPATEDAATPPLAASPSTADARGQGQQILLVEDEEGVRRLAKRLLEQLGYQVTAASNASQALELTRRMTRIDLLFTDVVLTEGLNGFQLTEQLRREKPDLPVLYTSGYSEEIIQRRGYGEGGWPLITKPDDRATLAEAVRAALETDASLQSLHALSPDTKSRTR